MTSPEALSGLTIEFRRPVETVPGDGRQLDAHRLILPALTAGSTLTVLIRYAP